MLPPLLLRLKDIRSSRELVEILITTLCIAPIHQAVDVDLAELHFGLSSKYVEAPWVEGHRDAVGLRLFRLFKINLD
jgi:hypothetical protein